MQQVPKKILLIEDDLDIQEALSVVLSEENYQIVTKSNGAEAWDYLSKSSQLPEMILLDQNMPIMTGFEFRKKQIENPLLLKIKTILLTAQSLGGEFKELNFDAILKKPIDIDLLLTTLRNFCEDQ